MSESLPARDFPRSSSRTTGRQKRPMTGTGPSNTRRRGRAASISAEDLWHPFTLSFTFDEVPSGRGVRRAASLVASTSPLTASDIHLLRDSELSRREELARPGPGATPLFRRLALASDQFLVAREGLTTVVAGYPWFSDWGRDTMIALPGLTLATGRPGIAREILLEFSATSGGADPEPVPGRRGGARIQHRSTRRSGTSKPSGTTSRRRATSTSSATPLRDPRGHRRVARARHALRHPRGRGRPPRMARPGRGADLDGRARRRAARHAARGKARRDPGPVVQRAPHDG